MKQIITFSILISLLQGCKKEESPAPHKATRNTTTNNEAPYGTSSKWKCIGGDTLIEEILEINLYYVEKDSPCDTYYYELSYPVWNDYDYSIHVSSCVSQKDTLIIKDLATSQLAYYIKFK